MTPRERLEAALTGAAVDRQPVFHWPGTGGEDVDIVARRVSAIQTGTSRNDQVCLTEIANPFFRALTDGSNLNELAKDSPEKADAVLDEYVLAAISEANLGLGSGADGVLYRLHGACPRHCSPMQYGGLYLERDRQVLDSIGTKYKVFVFIVGDEGAYLEFTSDLPCDALGWDVHATQFPVSQMKMYRTGAVFTVSADSEIRLESGLESGTIAQTLEVEFANA